jgi:D-alanyl-D-alanine carboxypeptidase
MLFHPPFCIGFHLLAVARKGETDACRRGIAMAETIFRNSHGLDEETKNYSTAKDMAILSSYANKLDVYKQISKTKKWTVQTDKKSYVWNNRNKLLYS